MATFAHWEGDFFVYKTNRGVSAGGMALVAIHTCRRVRVERLPFSKEDVKVVVKTLPLGNISVAFQAIFIRDGAGQRSWLRVLLADKSHQVFRAKHHGSRSTERSITGMAIDAASFFLCMKACQVGW